MSRSRHLLFVALGTGFWLNAALLIHAAGARVFSVGSPYLGWAYGLAIPLTLLSLYLTRLASGLRGYQLLEPVVVMTGTATCWDGLALAWFRPLYSQSAEVALYGAAWILWGVSLWLVAAYVPHYWRNSGRA